MLNDWEYALADNTSKGLFVASSKRGFVEAQKQKPSRKIYSKVLRQAIDPFVGSPCPAVVVGGGGGGGNSGFTFSFKGLNFTRGNKFVSTTSQKLTSSSRPSPGSPISEVFVPRGSSVPVPTGRKVKVFSEKLREPVQGPSCTNMILGYKVKAIPRQSKYPRQVPMSREKSLLVDTEIQTLLQKGEIKMIDSSQDKYLSSILLVEKKDSSQMPVINLKSLSQHIPYEQFKMEGLYLLKELLKEGDFLCNVDLKDAYFVVPVQ